MPDNAGPLVSVCTTFFEARRYFHRVLESFLHQTYWNIELVVIDNGSVDGTAEIVKEYAKKDSRIKYKRNDEATEFSRCLTQSFELAQGELVMMIGADDWLAKDYIEKGVRTFLKYPDIAGVIPRLVSLAEIAPDKFELSTETFSEFYPPRKYASEWYVKRMYKPTHLYIGALALMRKEDMVAALHYFLKQYCDNPPPSLPVDLHASFRKGFGIDAMLFLEILTRYRYFVFDSSMYYMKVALLGGQALQFDFSKGSLPGLLKNIYYYMLTFTYTYKQKWPKFYSGMKIFLGAEATSTAIVMFFRRGIAPFRLPETKKYAKDILKELNGVEIIGAIIISLWRIAQRALKFAGVNLFSPRKTGNKKRVLIPNNFLSAEGEFTVFQN